MDKASKPKSYYMRKKEEAANLAAGIVPPPPVKPKSAYMRKQEASDALFESTRKPWENPHRSRIIPFDSEQFNFVLRRLREGHTITSTLEIPGMVDHDVFYSWLGAPDSDLNEMLTSAQKVYAITSVDRVVDTINNCDGDSGSQVAKAGLQLRLTSWISERYNNKLFGNKQSQEVTGKDGEPLVSSVNVVFKQSVDDTKDE